MLVVFNLSYVLLSYPAGALGDRRDPRLILTAGIALLVIGNAVLATASGLTGRDRRGRLWGAHMALTQGLFAKLLADVAPPHLRATAFGLFNVATGIGLLLASLGAGLLWDRRRIVGHLPGQRSGGGGRRRHAVAASAPADSRLNARFVHTSSRWVMVAPISQGERSMMAMTLGGPHRFPRLLDRRGAFDCCG